MNIPSNITTLIAGIVLTLVSLWYGQNHGLLPVAASADAAKIDGLFNLMMTISTGLFIMVQGALIVAAIKFRRRPGDETDGPPIHGNLPLEALWTGIPVIIVLGISIYSFEVYSEMGGLDPMASHGGHIAHVRALPSDAAIAAPLPGSEVNEPRATDDSNARPQEHLALGIGAAQGSEEKPADLVIDVEALQFAWLFKYPNPLAETPIFSGVLNLPVDREVQLNITAKDVLHAFWVPAFRLKQDAIPGRTVELRFVPNREGTYSVICAELCGSYHGGMKTQTIVQSGEEFDEWYESQKQVALKSENNSTVASHSDYPDSPSEAILASYARELGVDAETLSQLHDGRVGVGTPLEHRAHHHHHHAASIPVKTAASPLTETLAAKS